MKQSIIKNIDPNQLSIFDLLLEPPKDSWESEWKEIEKLLNQFQSQSVNAKTYWTENVNVVYYSQNTCEKGHVLYTTKTISIVPHKGERFEWMEKEPNYYSFKSWGSKESKTKGTGAINSGFSGLLTFNEIIQHLERKLQYLKTHNGCGWYCEQYFDGTDMSDDELEQEA